MKNNILAIVIFYAFVSTILGGYTLIMQDDKITKLEQNQAIESSECVDGVLYATYSFKDLVVYEPKYVSCKKDKKND